MDSLLNGKARGETIEQEIHKIRVFLEEEIGEKKLAVRQLAMQSEELRKIIAQRDEVIITLETRLKTVDGEADGNRQLINKLLGDITKLHNDIEWYKRTYEKRSFLGVIKEKIFHPRLKSR